MPVVFRSAKRPGRGRAIVAAAHTIDLHNRAEARKQRALRAPWQRDAFVYRNSIGELRYGTNFLANAAARMKVYVAARAADGESNLPLPITDPSLGAPPEVIEAARLATLVFTNGSNDMSDHMRIASTNISLAGEAFILGQDDPETGRTTYSIRSVSEIAVFGDKIMLREGPVASMGKDGMIELDPDLTDLARMWQVDPEYRARADSAVRAIINECESLLILRRSIRAVGRSRYAGAGILLVPDELGFAEDVDGDGVESDPFLSTLTRNMMTPIADEGSASEVVPLVIRGSADALKEFRYIDIARSFDEWAIKIRQEIVGVIASGLDLPKEVIMGVADLNHWCVDEQTEILTRTGWKRHNELRIGDEVRSLNHLTGLAEWDTVKDIYRATVQAEPMTTLRGRSHSSMTTANHRWPVIGGGGKRLWRTSKTLKEQDRFTLAAPSGDAPTEAKWDDAFVELLGWYWTEGSVQKGLVTIAQSHQANPERVARIRRALTELYGPAKASLRNGSRRGAPGWRESIQENRSAHGRAVTVFHLNTAASLPFIVNAPAKCVARELIASLTSRQLELFIATSLEGDGWHYKSGQRDIFQSAPERLEALELAGVLAGYATTMHQVEGGWSLRLSRKATLRPIKSARQTRRKGGGGLTSEIVAYDGTVWCPTTGNSTWLARREGAVFYTGNSAWQVDDNTFRHHIEPHVIVLMSCFTDGFLKAAMTAMLPYDLQQEWLPRMTFWYDPTELVTHPDQTQNALNAHDRLAISDAALRRYLGLSEGDAPTAGEIEIRMIRNVRTLPPNLLMSLYHELDPSLAVPPITTTGMIPGVKPGLGGGAIMPVAPVAPGAEPAAPDATILTPTPPLDTGGTGGPPIGDQQAAAAARELVQSMSERQREEVKRAVLGELRSRGYQVTVPALTAASKPKAGADAKRLSKRLTAIDRDLRVKVQAAANAAVVRQLEKAGVRLNQRVAKNARLRALAASVHVEFIPARIGQAEAERLGIVASDLMRTEWDTLEATFRSMVGEAQRSAIKVAAQLAHVSEDEATQIAAVAMAQGVDNGWNTLRGALDSISLSALYNPHPNVSVADMAAALNPDSLVPTGVVRCALAVTGGAREQDFGIVKTITGAEVPAVSLGNPVGGVASGATISDLLTNLGASTAGYEWVHGPSDRPFPPHEALDGLEFDNFDDAALANSGDFPSNQFYFPGDHDGCLCDTSVLWVTDQDVADAMAGADA